MNKTLSISMILLSTALVSACAPMGRSMQKIGTAMHEESTAFDRRVRDMFDAEGIEREPQPRSVEPTYCYKTIGEVVCYREPLPGRNHQLVGKQVPEPAFADYAYPYPEEKPPAPMPVVVEPLESEPVMVESVESEPIAPADEPPIVDSIEPYVTEPVAVEMDDIPSPPSMTVPAPEDGGFVYEVPEYAVRPREDIPDYKKPRELIPDDNMAPVNP